MMVSENAVQRPVARSWLNGAGALPALLRTAVGVLLVPLFMALTGGDESALHLWMFFLLVLAALKVVPAVLRQVIPFPAETKARWFKQRVLGKRYDSYQWRKLVWVGVGLTVYLVVHGSASRTQIVLAAACLVGGGLGEYVWRRVARTL